MVSTPPITIADKQYSLSGQLSKCPMTYDTIADLRLVDTAGNVRVVISAMVSCHRLESHGDLLDAIGFHALLAELETHLNDHPDTVLRAQFEPRSVKYPWYISVKSPSGLETKVGDFEKKIRPEIEGSW